MGTFVNTIDALGDGIVADSIIDGSITEFYDDTITTINNYVFYPGPTELTVVNLPSATVIGHSAFEGNSKLTSVDLASVQRLLASAFSGCTSLTTVVIRTDTVPTNNGGILKNTPIESGTGHIYVPSALVDSYKAATNWSAYANNFRALEDYTVDGTITGELDTNKI